MKKLVLFCVIILFFVSVLSLNVFSTATEKDTWIDQSETPLLEAFTASWSAWNPMLYEDVIEHYDKGDNPYQFVMYDIDYQHAFSYIKARLEKYNISGIPYTVFEGSQEWNGYHVDSFDEIKKAIEEWKFTKTIDLTAKAESMNDKILITAKYVLNDFSEGVIHFTLISQSLIKDKYEFRNYVIDGDSFTVGNEGEDTITLSMLEKYDKDLLKVLVWVEIDGKPVANVWIKSLQS